MEKNSNRLLGIDALRGLAAILVLLYHSRATVWEGMDAFFKQHHTWSWDPQVWLGWVSTPLRAGFVGVQLLFVLSGYCIHRNQAKLLAKDLPAKLDLLHFAFRRFFRIYPTYVAALALNGLVLYQVIPWLSSRGFYQVQVEGGHSWYIFGMNLLTMQNILVPAYEGVFWSLSIEIHLYIVYPIILWVTRHYGPGRMMVVSFVAGMAHLLLAMAFPDHLTIEDRSVIGIFLKGTIFSAYWFTWCAGAYVAEMQFGRAKPIRLPAFGWVIIGMLGTALLMAATMNKKLERLQVGGMGEFLIALMMAAFLAWSLRPSVQGLWTSAAGRCLAFVGIFSFSLYAIHVPILLAFTSLWGGKAWSVIPPTMGCVVALVVAYGFFNLVERWTLKPPKGFIVTKVAPPETAEHVATHAAPASIAAVDK